MNKNLKRLSAYIGLVLVMLMVAFMFAHILASEGWKPLLMGIGIITVSMWGGWSIAYLIIGPIEDEK